VTAESSQPSHFKVLLINAENFFVFLEKYNGVPAISELTETQWQGLSTSFFNNKPIEKVRSLSRLIFELDPDLIMMTEVGGETSFKNFNQFFLENRYDVFTCPSNSDRGIDLGYLLKQKWTQTAKFSHYQNYPLPHPQFKRFSRNLLQLTFNFEGNVWHFFLLHLKSKLNKDKKDFEGRSRRAAEIKAVAEILQSLPSDESLILAGDFNGIAVGDDIEPEFLPLYDLKLQDVTEFSPLTLSEKFSYLYFDQFSKAFYQQLDYAFINHTALKKLVPETVCFPRYKTSLGHPLPIPQNEIQRRLLPSDHFPLWFEFNLRRAT
jgi:hypothetical protein